MTLILLGMLGLQDVENLDGFGGSPEARRVLLDRGFVVTDEQRRQICSYYIGAASVFITTDTLLYAYYVNLERAVLGLETKQAARLGPYLEKLAGALAKLRKKDVEPDGPSERLDLYLAVARALLDGKTSEEDLARLPEKAAQEIRLILKAEAPAVSPLRGLTLDYPRFAPRGLYAGRPALERFARSTTWLREVPFRAADLDEVRQLLLLLRARHADFEIDEDLRDLNAPYELWLGTPEDPGLLAVVQALDKGAAPLDDPGPGAQAALLKHLSAPLFSSIPAAGAQIDPATTKGFRLLPRPVGRDARIFGALAPPGLRRPLPSGEELMAALGSPVAREIVAAREEVDIPGYAALARAAAAVPAPASPFAEPAKRLLDSLLNPEIPETAPAWYRHAGWRAKDLNTALAGWAHERMIWDLHAHRNVVYGGLTSPPPGLIEPNPAFFDALLDLTLRADDYFRDQEVVAPRFPRLAILIRDVQRTLRRQLEGKELLEADRELLGDFGPRLGNICGFDGNSWLSDAGLPDTPFSASVVFEITRGEERLVGQGRPRAIYVVAEQKGRRYVARGGVLSYRDAVAPAAGPGRVSPERWRQAPPPPPSWTSRFAVEYAPKELHDLLEKGLVVDQMFLRPDAEMGEILARKLAARERFDATDDTRNHAVQLFARSGHPKVVEVLLALLKEPLRQAGSVDFRSWPEARTLEGRLKPEHLDLFLAWIADGHQDRDRLLALAATIPDPATRLRVLDAVERFNLHGGADGGWQILEELLNAPGLGMSREILQRLGRFPQELRATAAAALAERWNSQGYELVEEEYRLRAFTEEERAFRETLRLALKPLKIELK